MVVKEYNDNVFINCPFDGAFSAIFRAIIFAIFYCGFRARCSLENDDGSEVRIEKIANIIRQCRYGIHDISRKELDKKSNLPRFNMPLELGMFIGAKKYGDVNQKKKCCLITDSEEYRYQVFISDIAGQDIKAHDNEPDKAIRIIRDWLSSASRRETICGGSAISNNYKIFCDELPMLCKQLKWEVDEITFNDYSCLVSSWISDAS